MNTREVIVIMGETKREKGMAECEQLMSPSTEALFSARSELCSSSFLSFFQELISGGFCHSRCRGDFARGCGIMEARR